MDLNECGAPILCECEECGTKFLDTEGHTARECADARIDSCTCACSTPEGRPEFNCGCVCHGAGRGDGPPFDAATATGMYDHD